MTQNLPPASPDVYLKALEPDAQSVIGQSLGSLSDSFTQGLMNWGFEVIKHLAIFNGAGLAGIAAIAQAYPSNLTVHRLALQGMHLFISGLMVAIITMVVVFLSGFLYSFGFKKNVMLVLLSIRPLSSLKPPIWFWAMVALNWTLAAVSIGLFFAGAWKIVAIV